MMTKERIAELRKIAEVLERRSETFGKIGPSLTDCLSEIESLQSRVADLEKALRACDDAISRLPVPPVVPMQDHMIMRNAKDAALRAIDAAMKGTHDH